MIRLLDTLGSAPVAAMIGMCKNAGKTTAMNRLIVELAEAGRTAAVTSIGRDGETSDLVTGTAKPPIYLRRGMLAATAADLLKYSDISRELLDVTDWSTPLGPVVIFRAVSDGFVQLAGPSIMAHMRLLCEQLEQLGAGLVIMDGALSRRSPASGALRGCCVLSTGASYDKDMQKVVDDTAYIYRLMTLPQAPEPRTEACGKFLITLRSGENRCLEERRELENLLKKGEAGRLHLTGALTDSLARGIISSGAAREGFSLSVEDSSRILLSRGMYERLTARGAAVQVLRSTTVAAVTVNPVSAYGWRFDREQFLERMAGAVDAPVMDVEVMHD